MKASRAAFLDAVEPFYRRTFKVDIQEGDWVLVNLAPFIGTSRRSHESIPCRVLAADATHVEVRTEDPFREVSLRVLTTWIDGKLEPDMQSDAIFNCQSGGVAVVG
jgi:hypothetical protein